MSSIVQNFMKYIPLDVSWFWEIVIPVDCRHTKFIECLDFKWNLRWRERWNVCFSRQKGAGVTFQSYPHGSFPLWLCFVANAVYLLGSHSRVAVNQAKNFHSIQPIETRKKRFWDFTLFPLLNTSFHDQTNKSRNVAKYKTVKLM